MAAAPHPFTFRDYRFYWVARLSNVLAQSAMVVIIGWQVYDIARRTMDVKGAAFQLGLIGLFQFLPLALLTLITGWTADRIDRRLIVRITALIEVGCAAALGWMAWTGTTTLPAIFAVAVALGIVRAFQNPAMSALAPNLVAPETLPRAVAFSSASWQVGSICGPALGGFLYSVSMWLPYAVSAALFFLAFLALMLIRPIPRTTIAKAHPIRQMIDGLRYVRRNRVVLGSISLDLFAVLLGGATAMLPIYARDILHVGAAGLGPLRAAPAVGAAITAIFLSVRPIERGVGVKMFVAVGTFGAATVGFGLSRTIAPALAFLAILGAADMVSVFIRISLIQIHTPNEMRGRVSAVSSLFISGSNELGEAESGLLASLVGAMPAVIFGGVGAIAVTLLWAWLFPELRLAKSFDPPEHPIQEE
ncbi:MFS family permease [Sphingomonas vulcanisoli]|uniref:Multidrug efflux pump Tap n=1 Tax=Sphingomonas vulcanisoli TaxID=1658060 RepID=A0ABX0TMR9_9SPHN|nr:MFS transporter [Sphingomonas vulcanisoli]NIJ06819.1 MFS family permease [Sphingomonas vulcanisoli]